MSNQQSDTLIHYGVKGMKWGVRKDRVSKSSSRRSRKENASRNQRKDLANRRRTISEKDLDAMISRIQKEQKLKDLVAQDLNPGRAFVTNTMKNSGAKVAGIVATGAMIYAIRGILTKEWGLDKLASQIRLKK